MDGGVPFERHDRALRGWRGHAASGAAVFVAMSSLFAALDHGSPRGATVSTRWLLAAGVAALAHAVALAARSRYGKGAYFTAMWASLSAAMVAAASRSTDLGLMFSMVVSAGVLAAFFRGFSAPVLGVLSRPGRGLLSAWTAAHALSLGAVWVCLHGLLAVGYALHGQGDGAHRYLGGPTTALLAVTAVFTAWLRRRERRWHDALRAGEAPGSALRPALTVENFAELPAWGARRSGADGVLLRVEPSAEGVFREGTVEVPVARVPFSAMRGGDDAVWWLMAAMAVAATVISLR